jgi:glutamyl-tRNA synthetase
MTARVRFAPSPTGNLHLGSARTALFNFVFARKNNGVFILRIEDTDKERSKKEYVDDILESLKWLGIDWDEGPFFQSERTSLYQKIIEELLLKDKAYYCFCTKEELEQKRQYQISQGIAPKYDRKCLSLSKNEVNAKISQGLNYVIRLKVPDKILVFNDLLRGEIKYDLSLIGDFVIAKSETEPLFHLSTPIDDYYQGVTHIIRGADHIPNTPKQIMIYKALNWKIPIYVHIPLILGEGGGKLSKRHGAKSIAEYRKDGFLPEALVNFLILLGWHPQQDNEVINMKQIIEQFNIEKIEKKSAILNLKKLFWLNKVYLRNKSSEEIINMIENDSMFKGLIFYLKFYDYEKNLKIIELGKERANTIREIFETVKFFFESFDYPKELLVWKNYSLEEIKKSLINTYESLKNISEDNFKADYLKLILDSLSEDKGYIYWPLRVALTGLQASPPPIEIMEIIGKNKTLNLLEKAINKI